MACKPHAAAHLGIHHAFMDGLCESPTGYSGARRKI